MAKFKNGDLVENVGDGCRSIVVDSRTRRNERALGILVVDVEGPGAGLQYVIRETVLRLVEER